MLARVTVKDWNPECSRRQVEEQVLKDGLAQNFESSDTTAIYGDYIDIGDPLTYMKKVTETQKTLVCTILIQVSG